MDKTMKTAEDILSFGQANVEALIKASQIWVAGVQDMSRTLAASAQAQMDHAMATAKAMSGVKSIKDALDLQTSFARATIEKTVTETGKITDATLKLAEQAMAPIGARMSLAVESFGRTQA